MDPLTTGSPPTVALVGTLDTKGQEYQWVANRLADLNVAVVVIDAGTGEPHGFGADIAHDRHEVASAGHTTIDALLAADDRGLAVRAMGEGAANIVQRLVVGGEVHGVLALGGSGGSSIAARVVRDLPIGLPKLLVSTMASGDVSPYVGSVDLALVYSVVDIAGINRISRAVLGNAAAAIAGMVSQPQPSNETGAADRPVIAASMFGVTTPAVDAARRGPGSTNSGTRFSSSTRPDRGVARSSRWRGRACWPAYST